MSRSVLHKAETVCSNDGACMDDDAIPNADILVKDYAGVKSAIISDDCVLADVASSLNHRPVSYRSTRLDHHVGADLHTLGYPCGGCHGRTGMNTCVITSFDK